MFANTIEAEPKLETAPGKPANDSSFREGFVDSWLYDHLNAVVFVVLAAGFGLRVFAAGGSYLNPDEALHFLIINQSSAWLAYKASLSNAHPPLIYLVVYYWRFLGSSELMLRMPSVITGTVFCWALYKWLGVVFGKVTSVVGLILASFSPCFISLSAELRAYTLLLFCMACALYFLARALKEQSVGGMWIFSGFLYLAILSHYSAAFFTLGLGIYALAEIADSRPPWKLIIAWAAGQAGALAIYAFLYVTHISKIKQTDAALWAIPYHNAFFHFGDGNLLTFTRDQTSQIFLFLFEQEYIAQAMLLLYIAAVGFLFFRDFSTRNSSLRFRHLGILLLLPFIAVWGAAVAGIYPYIGGRHTVFLAPFAVAAVSYLLASVFGRRLWAAVLIAVLLVAGSNTSGKTFEPYIKKENQRRSLMADAMAQVHQSVPRADVIFVDVQSSYVLEYYLCGSAGPTRVEAPIPGFSTFACDGYSVVSTDYHIWQLTPNNFGSQFQKMAAGYGLKPGNTVWVFQAGWGANLSTELSWFVPKFRCMAPKNFGENITVIPFSVGPDLSPALPAGSPHLTSLGRCSN